MEGGRILQVGTPKQIYNHPARRFVADFIGDINILAAELLDTDGDTGTVRLPGGVLRRARLPDRDIGAGAVHVAVRPEHAGLERDDDGASLRGTVTNVVYFGTGTHYHLRIDDDSTFVVRVQSRHDSDDAFAIGDVLSVRLADNTVQVLRD
jgi:spermidine/putrescine transport system ATP-binding protein